MTLSDALAGKVRTEECPFCGRSEIHTSDCPNVQENPEGYRRPTVTEELESATSAHVDDEEEVRFEFTAVVDGTEARVVKDPPAEEAPVDPRSRLEIALEYLAKARERYDRMAERAKEANGFKKDAQEWLNECVGNVIAAHELEHAQPELPL